LKRASWGRTGHQAALVASSEEQKRTRSTTERRNVDRSSPPVSVDLPVPPLLASLSPGSGRRPDCLSACSMRNALASLERRLGHMPSLASIGLTLRSLILFLSPPLCCCRSLLLLHKPRFGVRVKRSCLRSACPVASASSPSLVTDKALLFSVCSSRWHEVERY
jgi:hypothetical protein